MKTLIAATFVALGVMSMGAAQANADLAEANCGKCHALDKKKKGPSFKQIAAKYKGKADAEAAVYKAFSDPNGDHPEVKVKPEDAKTVIKWVLQQ
jgi:cytochrome c